VQVSPSDDERVRRSEALPSTPDRSATIAEAAEATANLQIARVPVVIDDNVALATAALRTALAARVPHHIEPSVAALIIAGPFGIGKRHLMQRMLMLYPDGFAMPPVYTTHPEATGGQLKVVEQVFVDDLKAWGLLAFEENAVGERYAVSLEDVAECAACLVAGLWACLGYAAVLHVLHVL
jgi:hypothetical protein